MNLATHTLVGMTIGKFSKEPLVALAAGAASHAVLDCLPHQDSWHPLWRLIDGTCTVVALTWALGSPDPERKIAGAIGALVPDVENIYGHKGVTEPKKIFPSHWFRHETRSAGYGAAVELLVVAITFAILCWPCDLSTSRV